MILNKDQIKELCDLRLMIEGNNEAKYDYLYANCIRYVKLCKENIENAKELRKQGKL